jgi:DNA polymerase III delta prime subunit
MALGMHDIMKGKTRLIILCLALIALLTTVVGILGSFASSLLPEPIVHYVWPLLGIVIIMLIGVTVFLYRLQSETKSPLPMSTLSGQNRQHLIAKVRDFWITGFLEQSLHGAALMALGLQSQPDALENSWRLVLQQANQSAHTLAAGTRITKVFDEGSRELLILGEPGAGKTTLLLELARDLLNRAQGDENFPVPMIFNLSSWAVKRQPLADWLVEEMNIKYQVPRHLGQSWVNTNQVLLLLDGLDEVNSAYRAACVDAINTYRSEHGLVPIVVCSRSADYLELKKRLLLQSAVIVQPLTERQIDEYLSSAGEQLDAVRVALRDDHVLQELMTTPLMHNVLTLGYHSLSDKSFITTGSLETRRRHIFENYVRSMLQRRVPETRYTMQKTISWLTWLAKQMAQHSQTEFYIEWMQVNWLPDSRSRFVCRMGSTLLGGLLGGLLFGLVSGLAVGLFVGLAVGPLFGLVFGLFVGLLVELLVGGGAFIMHFVLRWFLWRAGSIPWNYPRFLDYAASRILLRKIGGGYVFIHRLLLEYFAELDNASMSNNVTKHV